jgi:hypothetical protein|tara:strand:+ start:227 stop:400 length:174 start_codon:yes stop_codon:yes gene_type:complete
MKDKDNVLKWLDEVDNMIMIMDQAVERKMPIDPLEARRRFNQMRKRLKTVIDRVTGS